MACIIFAHVFFTICLIFAATFRGGDTHAYLAYHHRDWCISFELQMRQDLRSHSQVISHARSKSGRHLHRWPVIIISDDTLTARRSFQSMQRNHENESTNNRKGYPEKHGGFRYKDYTVRLIVSIPFIICVR